MDYYPFGDDIQSFPSKYRQTEPDYYAFVEFFGSVGAVGGGFLERSGKVRPPLQHFGEGVWGGHTVPPTVFFSEPVTTGKEKNTVSLSRKGRRGFLISYLIALISYLIALISYLIALIS